MSAAALSIGADTATAATRSAAAVSADERRMTREQFATKRFQISVAAGMNQRYHQHEALRWWRWDTGAKIVTAVFAVIALSLAIVLAVVHGEGWETWHYSEVVIAFVAAVAAIVLNVFPFGSWEAHHTECFRRWSDLREEADGLEFDIADGDPTDDAMEHLQELDAKLHRLCGAESLADEWLWHKCQNDERRSRGLPLLASRAKTPFSERVKNLFRG